MTSYQNALEYAQDQMKQDRIYQGQINKYQIKMIKLHFIIAQLMMELDLF